MVRGKLRLGVVGCGGAGGGSLAGIAASPVLELAAAAESDEKKRNAVEESRGVECFSDYGEMLEKADVDLVYNATPNFLHSRVAVDALTAGKHVFSEKPMGMNRDELRDMLRAEKESGKRLQINFEMRYSLMSRRVKQIVDDGEIGEVKNIFFAHNQGGTGFRKKTGDWRADPGKAGSYYIEEGCHRLDIFRYWMGGEIREVEAVPAPGLRGEEGWQRGYREPACTLCFFEGGKLANLVTLQHRGAGVIEEPGTEPELGHEYTASLMGSEGSMRVDFWKKYIQLFQFSGETGAAKAKRIESFFGVPDGKLHHDSFGHMEDFALRLIEGREPLMDALDSCRTMEAVFACDESFGKNGARVKVDYTVGAAMPGGRGIHT